MFFPVLMPILYFLPTPFVVNETTPNFSIREYYDKQLEDCSKCYPMKLQKDGTFKLMKQKEFRKYLEKRIRLYAHEGVEM